MVKMKELIFMIHLVTGMFWVGGMLFMVFVLSPYIRNLPDRVKHFKQVGRKFSILGTFIGLPILFITGLINFSNMCYDISELINPTTSYSETVKLKIFLFFIVVIISLSHDLYFGTKSDEERYRKIAKFLGIINLIASLVIVYLAVRLRFGG